ncbi:MAG TPA: tRNA (adenosine(37)-N6)-threonylcarbamoyltransferase complex dimerization subunit type 1 TsaB [Rectinemataceae bacterium]|nr:tRNA (adenosine(37)-N6)-threonylcarbamoyltransferase complex dimerization subunit type 1 TsaB [Rectinemataceae bacterium]
MNVLAFDCSSDVLSVALRIDEGWAEASLDLGLKHAEHLMGLVDSCMKRAGMHPEQLDLVACMLGPGSFTGLRIGMATAKGMAIGLGKPFVAVPTLDCLAWGHEWAAGVVVPVMDGKKGRLYSALYERGRRTSGWLDLPLASLLGLLDTYNDVLITGPDAELLSSVAGERSGFRIDPRAGTGAARALAELGMRQFSEKGPTPADAGPLYLRPSEAEESAAARRAASGEVQ